MKIEISEQERKFMILVLRHMQECPSVPIGKGIRPLSFMISNKVFGRGYKEGDWTKHMEQIVKEQIKNFEPTWTNFQKTKANKCKVKGDA